MKRRWLLIAFLTTTPLQGQSEEINGHEIAVISPVEVQEKLSSSPPVILVDARLPKQFRKAHIPGAINVPPGRAGELVANVPKDAEIVVYCGDPKCDKSRKVISELLGLGFTKILHMKEGLKGWRAAGFPTQKGRAIHPPKKSSASLPSTP